MAESLIKYNSNLAHPQINKLTESNGTQDN